MSTFASEKAAAPVQRMSTQPILNTPTTSESGLNLAAHLGNSARLEHSFGNIPIQPGFKIGPAHDKYEEEASQIARHVTLSINAPSQSPAPGLDSTGRRPNIQRMSSASISGLALAPNLEARIQSARRGGQSLAASTRAPMESTFGFDFSQVRVHADVQADQLNQSLQAHAFTTGQDIFFRQGKYNPGQPDGQELLAHELTHVVQQNGRMLQGSVTTAQDSTTGSAKPVIQRLAVSDSPIDAQKPPLQSISEIPGGHKGKIYLLKNNRQKLIVKFQNEAPKEAILGTNIVKAAGANTPDVRLATQQDLANITAGLHVLGTWTYAGMRDVHAPMDITKKGKFAPAINNFTKDSAKFAYKLVMDFAEGRTIKKMMDVEPRKLMSALKSKQFQMDLGRMLAADAFSGNPDRAFAGHIGASKELSGWYHEQNFFIKEEANAEFSAVAIDNAFAPFLASIVKPFGRYIGNIGVQFGSVAAANPKLFKEEAGLIFDRIIQEINSRYKNNDAILQEALKLQAERQTFAENAASGAEEAMRRLLKRGQGWKAQLAGGGAQDEEQAQFRERKRYLRLIAGNQDPEKGRSIANDKQAYRRWVLTQEIGLSDEEADQVLQQGDNAYKERVKRGRK